MELHLSGFPRGGLDPQAADSGAADGACLLTRRRRPAHRVPTLEMACFLSASGRPRASRRLRHARFSFNLPEMHREPTDATDPRAVSRPAPSGGSRSSRIDCRGRAAASCHATHRATREWARDCPRRARARDHACAPWRACIASEAARTSRTCEPRSVYMTAVDEYARALARAPSSLPPTPESPPRRAPPLLASVDYCTCAM